MLTGNDPQRQAEQEREMVYWNNKIKFFKHLTNTVTGNNEWELCMKINKIKD